MQSPGCISVKKRVTALTLLFFSVWLASPLKAADLSSSELVRARSLAQATRIYRDIYGVPHIFGKNDWDCVFGYLYAQAEDDFAQIEDSYIHALGRAAEVYGSKALPEDLLVRALEIPGRAQEIYRHSDERMKKLYDAAALALNYYLARHPSVKPVLITHFEPWHVPALDLYLIYVNYVLGSTGQRLSVPPLGAGLAQTAGTIGSNAWAIGPSKSISGRAMLLINPHVPFSGPLQLYEGHLHSDQGWNISGASPLGLIFPVLGHNDVLGWGHTVNFPYVATFYKEIFDNPNDSTTYRYGEAYRKATDWIEKLKIKTENGGEQKDFRFRKTHHGPVVGTFEGHPLSVRLAGLKEGDALEEWYDMGKSHSLGEFKKAMSHLAIPMFNTVYADRDGNIFYVYNARISRRSENFAWESPVDGSNPESEWQEYLKFSELPQVTNPAAGFIQNCNSTPFLTSDSGNPLKSAYPSYVVPQREQDSVRAQSSRQILSSKSKFNFEEWSAAAFNTREVVADTLIPALLDEWQRLRESGPERASAFDDVIGVLRSWDHVSRVDSVAMTIFDGWYYNWRTHEKDKATWTKLQSLQETMNSLTRTWGTWKVAWGDVNRLQRISIGQQFSDDRPSLGIPAGPARLGNIFTFESLGGPSQKRRYGYLGDSYVSVIEFGPHINAKSLLVFGESADSTSLHYFDQGQLYSNGKFKPAWFTLQEIRMHTEVSYHPGEETRKRD